MNKRLHHLPAAWVLAVVALTSACSVAGPEPAEQAAPSAEEMGAEMARERLDAGVRGNLEYLSLAIESYVTGQPKVDYSAVPAGVTSLANAEKSSVIELAVARDGASYCLRGWNPDGNHTAATPLFYSSAEGAVAEEPHGLCAVEDAEFVPVKRN